MIRNTPALTQFEALLGAVEERSASKHAILKISPNHEVKIEDLSWREFSRLQPSELEFTVSRIVVLAQEKFFDDLCIRFGMLDFFIDGTRTVAGADSVNRSLKRLSSRSEVMGVVRDRQIHEAQVHVLRDLSDGMVRRIAEIHGLIPSMINRNTQSLEVGNVHDFLSRIHHEAHDVYGVYLGEHDIQEKYRQLTCVEPPMHEIIRFINDELAKTPVDIRIPVDSARDANRPHFSEIMSLELISSHLVYKLPTISQEERSLIRLQLYIQGHGLVTYRVEPEIDLWSGLIAYQFSPVDKPNAPDIISVRGTQRRRDLAGFLASMISIWHPLGPGGNALTGSGAKMLEEKIRSNNRRVILTGHSMGAEIAVTLAKRESIQGLVDRTYSFSNPGRNKHHMTGEGSAVNVHHFVSASDPVAHLGDFRDGRVNLIYSHEMLLPDGLQEMFRQAPAIILNNHCMPQTLGKKAWMAVELRPGACIGRFNPAWGFLHRFVSNTLYGPWKMVAIVSWVALPILQKLATLTHQGCEKIYTWVVLPIKSLWHRPSVQNLSHPSATSLVVSS